MKITIIIIATILNTSGLIFNIFKEIECLKWRRPGGKCQNLQKESNKEVCSSYLWRKLIFDNNSYCKREKCPGFVLIDNGKEYRILSIWTVCEIILKQIPAITVIVLLLKELA